MQEHKERDRTQEYATTGSAEDGVSPKIFFELCPMSFRCLRGEKLMQPETGALINLAAVYLHNIVRRNSSRYTHTPLGIFDAECPDTGELRLGDWRNDHETRLEDFPRIARKSAIKAALARQ
jgi:hypothetical protein